MVEPAAGSAFAAAAACAAALAAAASFAAAIWAKLTLVALLDGSSSRSRLACRRVARGVGRLIRAISVAGDIGDPDSARRPSRRRYSKSNRAITHAGRSRIVNSPSRAQANPTTGHLYNRVPQGVTTVQHYRPATTRGHDTFSVAIVASRVGVIDIQPCATDTQNRH